MDITKLVAQFAPMAQMFNGGSNGLGMGDPMTTIRNVMGDQRFNEFSQLVNQGKQSGQSPEEFVKQMFKSSGMDMGEVRKALGI